MFGSVASLLLAASLALGPSDITTGRLEILRRGDTTGEFSEACNAILVSRDTILTRASCFQRNLLQGQVDPTTVVATFSLQVDGSAPTQETGTILAVDVHPDFQPIDCGRSEFFSICAEARSFCMQQMTGQPRLRCLARPEYFARSLLLGRNSDLALAYVNRSFQSPPTAIAQGVNLRSGQDSFLTALQLDDVALLQRVLSSTPFNLRMPFDQSMWAAPVGLAYATSAHQQHGLIALPSRLAELVNNTTEGLMLEYSRIDTPEILSWITAQMDQAVVTGKRADTSKLTFIDVSPPVAPNPGDPKEPEPSPGEPQPPAPPLPSDPPAENPHTPPAPTPTPEEPAEPIVMPPESPSQGPHGLPTDLHVPRSAEALPPKGGCGGNGLEEWSVLLFLPALRRRRLSRH